MKIYSVNDPEFKEYGRVIKGYDLTELLEGMRKTPCPDDVIYVPGNEELEKLPVAQEISDGVYGFMPIQIGYCNGHNTKLNALEYHRNSEINIPVDQDAVLLVAKRSDLDENFNMDTDKVKAFFAPAGTMVEVYATTLHYAPCQTSEEGFRVVIILPKGTNYDLPGTPEAKDGEEALLTATNKWLVAHPDGGCGEGVHLGLKGKNIDIAVD